MPGPHTLGKTKRVEVSRCLNCGEPLDGATGIDQSEMPAPGDATVCLYCGHLMTFGDDGKLRNPSDDEIVQVAGDDRLLAVQAARVLVPRRCGECTLCCKLLPVRSLGKGSNERCKHQSHAKGCKVYSKLWTVSPECSIWNCRWLVNDDTADLSRPDRSHYVIDLMPDFITYTNDETGEKGRIEVVQVWVDPAHRDAHHDPALRAYLTRRAHEGKAALIRYSSRDGFILVAPPMTGGGWVERRGEQVAQHTPAQIFGFEP